MKLNMSPHEIVARVSKLHLSQKKKAKKEGYHHPAMFESSSEIEELITKFELDTGLDWDTHAQKYLEE